MKKIYRQVVLIACMLLFAFHGFAAGGIKTIVKGAVQGMGVKKLFLYNRESARTIKDSDSVPSNGQFQLESNLTQPGFYVISGDPERVIKLELYLTPGDQLSVNLVNGQFVFSGKGSQLNQFLYDNNRKNHYTSAGLANTYNERVNAIKASGNAAVIRHRALLLGNEQGEYLDQVFGPVIESKAHGDTNVILEADIEDLNIRLVPEIMAHPKWWQTVTELMYAKMKAGQLKVSAMNTWMADFGNAIENQKLKEAFMLVLLDNSIIMGDFRLIDAEMKAVFPLVRNPANIAKMAGLKAKLLRNRAMFKYAPVRTDMSAYTFSDLNGKQVSISDFKGKLIFIDIWNTGCKPCIAEMPFLNRLEHDMKDMDIVFLSVSCDYNVGVWKKFLQKRNVSSGHQLIIDDVKTGFFDKIGKSGIPRFVILDKEGKVADNNTCKRPSNPLLKIYLTELLNQS